MTVEALKERLEADTCLPYGEQLRILLNSSHITYGEVSDALRKKGVFCYNSDKAFSVPLLSSSLLRPSDFIGLLEASVSREQAPKEKSEKLKLVDSGKDWITSLKQIDLFSLVTSHLDSGSISFESEPELVISGCSASIKYKIKRTDYSKDLLERELYFKGEVSVSNNNGSLELNFVSTHTSKETDKINAGLVRGVAKHLQKDGITTKDQPEKITFKLFDNKQRVVFMMKLVENFSEDKTIGQIVDFTLKRNEAQSTLPDDPEIKWMENAVVDIKMGGRKLNEVFLLNTEKYYDYYFILKVSVQYKYTFGPNTGTCQVSYYFDVGNRRTDIDSSEFVFSLDRINNDGLIGDTELHKLKNKIYVFVRAIVSKAQSEVLNK